MQRSNFRRDLLILALFFIVSRLLMAAFGMHMSYRTLIDDWQYLDLETLKHNLWLGVWYDHAQPPVFNLFLGIVLKLAGSYAPGAFVLIFKIFTLVITFLLYTLLTRLVPNRYIPLLISLLYLLSPATMIFEGELFYTSFITMFLMISAYFILQFQDRPSWRNTLGFFLPLIVVGLTRSMYHLLWLGGLSVVLLFFAWKKSLGSARTDPGSPQASARATGADSGSFKKLLAGSLLSLALLSVWYIKNFVIFHQFSTSTWQGMNLARNVFYDHPFTAKDSTYRIEALEPFSDLSVYKHFIRGDARKRYAGLNDRDLLQEWKNDTVKNENNVDYIEVSQQYNVASIAYIKAHPMIYAKNVGLSAIMFFGTATRYPHEEYQVKKIRYYDLIYSFNLSNFVTGKPKRRVALLLSAIPKFCIYCLVFFVLIRAALRQKSLTLLNAFIFTTMAYVFSLSSMLEHYENMRFRYEIEPLFLLLLGQALWILWQSRQAAQHEKGEKR